MVIFNISRYRFIRCVNQNSVLPNTDNIFIALTWTEHGNAFWKRLLQMVVGFSNTAAISRNSVLYIMWSRTIVLGSRVKLCVYFHGNIFDSLITTFYAMTLVTDRPVITHQSFPCYTRHSSFWSNGIGFKRWLEKNHWNRSDPPSLNSYG